MKISARYAAPLMIALLLVAACGGRSLNKNLAQSLITKLPPGDLQREDVSIGNVTQVGGDEAIVETRLKTVFRFKKIDGDWVVREILQGPDQWVNIDQFFLALRTVQVDETKKILNQVAAAIEEFRKKNRDLPVFDDYVELSDQLSPAYMSPLIRLDSWRHPLSAVRLDSHTIRLSSPGPDGNPYTDDDIILTPSFPYKN
jgi:hypothetical protein